MGSAFYPISDVFFQAEDGIRDRDVTGVQTCAFRSLTWLFMNLLCNRFPIAGSDKICILSRLQCSSTRNLVCYLLWRLLSLACLSLDSCLIVFKSSAVHSHLHLSFFLELCSSVFPKSELFWIFF